MPAAARVSKTAIQWARKEGIAVGMLRPITLFPFPGREVFELAKTVDVSCGRGWSGRSACPAATSPCASWRRPTR